MASTGNASSDISFYIIGLVGPVNKSSKLGHGSCFGPMAGIVICYSKDTND